ncbi:Deleted in malignant brain tumors 1 protein [Bagarius yarrelli]|uniref:Deleted in malignant brain tumors 1 protein n=1 Tax=Bagarius yarrelli TaxID=175774 RepID=A0A556VAT7_BAGYA|nr:Deleted in malignant brain tumors 1 protein [Bagarius yarrelli]
MMSIYKTIQEESASPISPLIKLYKEDQGELEVQDEVLEGTSLSLICSARSPCPFNPPSFSWNYLPEERRPEQNHNTRFSFSQLNFIITHLHHRLQFTCTATYQLQNQNKSAQSSYTLQVLYAPRNTSISASPSASVLLGSSVSLSCRSDANPAVLNYTWYRENEEHIGIGNHLFINTTDSTHSGLYYCRAQNQYGYQKASVYLNLQYAPQVSSTSSCSSSQHLITCSCEVHGNPPPTLLWHLSGETVLPSETMAIREESVGDTDLKSFITFHPLFIDMPTLQCIGVNKLGVDTHLFSPFKSDSVRLVNGVSRCDGRVEVFHDNKWGTVCRDDWDLTDAAVVCRELHCGDSFEVTNRYLPGSGPIWMDNVDCKGLESTLKDCRSQGWGKHNCNHFYDAGVVCSGPTVRLTAGPHQCSGRVEVFNKGSWSTVCDADFNQQNAEVVCRDLDCGIPVKFLEFSHGKDQVWTAKLQCEGNEPSINFCPTSSSVNHLNCSDDNDVGLICSGHTVARLINGMDLCSGRVEIMYLEKWGTVCDVGWNMRAAEVLCAQLGCGTAVALVEVDWFGEGNGHIWADVFDCQGNETHLSQCHITSWSRATCSHKQDSGVICNGSSLVFYDGQARLSGGSECQGELEVYFRQDWRRVLWDSWNLSDSSVLCRQLGCGPVINNSFSRSNTVNNHTFPRSIRLVSSGGVCAGRLEVFHRGSWGTVCDDSWDIKDAQVVCRQLQCGDALTTHIPAWFGPGTGSIWLNEVECEGNEMSMWNCRFQLSEEGECGHQEDVGVVCTEFNEIRLTEGCEGNLELFYNGTWDQWPLRLSKGKGHCSGVLQVFYNFTWSFFCEDRWNMENAQVVCRHLGCGSALSADNKVPSGSGSETICLDRVKCRGNEINLWDCYHSMKKRTNCSYWSYVTCADPDIPSVSSTTQSTTNNKSERVIRIPSSTPPLVLVVLGTMLFLTLVLSLILFYRNRLLSRVKSAIGEKVEYYDVIDTSDIISGFNSDAVPAGPVSDSVEDDEAENYDDVINADQKSVLLTDDVCENYDDAVTTVTNSNIITEDYDDVITKNQDVGDTEDGVSGMPSAILRCGVNNFRERKRNLKDGVKVGAAVGQMLVDEERDSFWSVFSAALSAQFSNPSIEKQ